LCCTSVHRDQKLPEKVVASATPENTRYMTNEKLTRFTSVKTKGGASGGKSAKIQVTLVNFK